MPAFNTPHGIFETSFFAIAESLPKRLLKDSEVKPAVYSEFDAQEGTPYVRDIPLGVMSNNDINTLDFVLAGIAVHNKETPPFELNAYMDNKDSETPQCFIRYMGRRQDFDQAQALRLTNATASFKEYILDSTQYEKTDFVENDSISPGYMRRFDRTEAFQARVAERLVTAYGDESSYYIKCPLGQEMTHLYLEDSALKAMLASEIGAAKAAARR